MKLKLIAIFSVLALFTLTGCSAEGQKFFNALQKTSSADYFESETKMTLAIDYDAGGDADFNSQMRALKHIFAGTVFELNAKSANDGSQKTELNYSFEVDPVSVKAKMWSDVSAEEGKYNIIVEVPETFKGAMPEEYAKDYMFIDLPAMIASNALDEAGLDLGNIYGIYNEDFLNSISLDELSALDSYMSFSSSKNGKLETLTLNMNKEQFLAFYDAYLSGTYGNITADDFEAMDNMDLTYSINVNPDGYIESAGLSVNVKASDPAAGSSAFVDITMNAGWKYTQINGSGEVALPELTEQNSFDLSNMLIREKMFNEFPSWRYLDEDGVFSESGTNLPLTGTYKGKTIDGTITLVKPEDGSLEITNEEFERIFGAAIATEVVSEAETGIELYYAEMYADADFGFDKETGTVLIRDR